MERRFNFWVYISKAEDAEGLWVAHCLDLDVISQGSTPAEARDSLEEAVLMVLIEDLNQGINPLDRPSAPQEDWDALGDLQRIGRPVDMSQKDVAEKEEVSRFATLLSFSIEQAGEKRRTPGAHVLGSLPLQLAAEAA